MNPEKNRTKLTPATTLVNIYQFCWGFAYYGIYGLLAIFFIKYLNISESKAMALIGVFGALGPILSALGAYVCDRFLGVRRGLYLGNIFFIVSYALLSVAALYKNEALCFFSLALISVSSGLSRTAPIVVIARSYPTDSDPRLEKAMTYNYMYNNLGGFPAQILYPTLIFFIGYFGTFFISTLLMLFSLIALVLYKNILQKAGNEPDKKPFSLKQLILFKIYFFICVVFVFLAFNHLLITHVIIYLLGIFCFLFLGYQAYIHKDYRTKLIAAIILLIETLIFFIYYNQLFLSMNFYAIHMMKPLSIFGFTLQPAAMLGFNPFWIIILSPIIAKMVDVLEKRKKNPHIAVKFAFGVFCSAIAFAIFGFSTHFIDPSYKIPCGWFILANAFQALSELLISALGIAALLKLAPASLSGYIVSLRMVVMSMTSIISSVIASSVALPDSTTGITPAILQQAIPKYNHFFILLSLFALGSSLVMLLLVPFIKKLIHEKI